MYINVNNYKNEACDSDMIQKALDEAAVSGVAVVIPKINERTGKEIWDDTEGKVDIFVACIGTGGTVSGTGKYLKSKNPDIKVIGVEPYDSPLITKGTAGPHGIQGIGANFIPDNLDMSVIDEVLTVKTEDAFAMSKAFAKSEGLLVGISSGAALMAAKEISGRPENEGKKIVVLLPDSGERYMSVNLFE